MEPQRTMFSPRQAAELCRVSEKTIKRKLASLAEHGATKDALGHWQIPYVALLAVDGLSPGRPTPPEGASRDSDPPEMGSLVPASETVSLNEIGLQERLARAEAERDSARREIETQTRAIDGLMLALRAIESGPRREADPAVAAESRRTVDLRERPDTPAVIVPRTWREWRRARKAANLAP